MRRLVLLMLLDAMLRARKFLAFQIKDISFAEDFIMVRNDNGIRQT